MFLNFIGSGSALNTALGNNSAFIKGGQSILLLDCGSTTFSRIQSLNLLKDIKNIYVLITHRHPDHISSLGDLIFYTRYIIKASITVLTPDDANVSKILNYMGVSSELYSLIKLTETFKLKNSDLEIDITPVPVQHVEDMECYGYILDYQGCKIYYSGDSKDISEDILKLFEEGKIDYIYQDVCSYNDPNGPHLHIDKLSRLIKERDRNRAFCMHYDESFDKDKILNLGFKLVYNITS